MPALTLKYRPIQYVEDVFKGEGRNIGVIAYGVGKSYFRCLGDAHDGRIDVAPFSCLSKTASLNAWVFREWAAWFSTLAVDCRDRDSQLLEYLQDLENDGAPFVAGKEGVIEILEGGSAVDAVSWLYSRLVREPRPIRGNFQAALKDLLTRSELEYLDGFEKDVEIEFMPAGAASARISTNYALSGKIKAIFKVLRFKGARDHLIKRVNDVIYTFQQAIEHGFTTKRFCFVLTDTPTSQNKDLHSLLEGHGVVIDITENGAPKRLERLLKDY